MEAFVGCTGLAYSTAPVQFNHSERYTGVMAFTHQVEVVPFKRLQRQVSAWKQDGVQWKQGK